MKSRSVRNAFIKGYLRRRIGKNASAIRMHMRGHLVISENLISTCIVKIVMGYWEEYISHLAGPPCRQIKL
jgi:hypothetical protein